MRTGFGPLRRDRIDSGLVETARLFDRRRGADDDDIARLQRRDLRRRRYAEREAENRRPLFQHRLQLVSERIARHRRQSRRRQAERGMRFADQFEHWPRVDRVFGSVAAGEQIDIERTICQRPHPPDGRCDLFRLGIGPTPGAQPAGVRYGGREFRRAAGTGHRRQQNGVLDAEPPQQDIGCHIGRHGDHSLCRADADKD
ncbi:MAG: hypothetical protein WBE82_12145 [Xanthobacteraceae bacterium]